MSTTQSHGVSPWRHWRVKGQWW